MIDIGKAMDTLSSKDIIIVKPISTKTAVNIFTTLCTFGFKKKVFINVVFKCKIIHKAIHY